MARFSGTVTTSGNSRAIRFQSALFAAHPEFEQGTPVTVSVIAPGQMLVSVTMSDRPTSEDDPIFSAFLAFIAREMEQHPEKLTLVSEGPMARLAELTEGIDVNDDEVFPDDVTI